MTEHFEKQTERIRKRNDEDYDEVSFSDNFSRDIVFLKQLFVYIC